MRIAIVAEPFVPIPPLQYGSTEQVISYLIRGLVETGHEPILLAPGDSKINCELIPICETAIHFPKHNNELSAHRELAKQIRHHTHKLLKTLLPRIDIIRSHGYDLRRFEYFPNVTTLHNKIDLSNVDYYTKRKNLTFVSISKNQQAVYPELNYAGVVYNGEDPREFPINTEPQDYVCFLGRFDRDKNPHLAIQLAINMGKKIKLGGKIDYRSEGYFEEEVAKYFNHPLVEYLGELDFEAKVELLSNAKCNLHPTNFREPFGLTVLEAAYCGTPTLAIARGSMPELIEPGRTGALVEDFIEGRQHLDECIAMDRRYIASRARQLFNYRNMSQQYIDIYQTVIRSHEHNPHKIINPLRHLWRHTRRFLITK